MEQGVKLKKCIEDYAAVSLCIVTWGWTQGSVVRS